MEQERTAPTLDEWMGGRDAIERLFDASYARGRSRRGHVTGRHACYVRRQNVAVAPARGKTSAQRSRTSASKAPARSA